MRQLELALTLPKAPKQDSRVFLGWQKPCLHAAVEHLLKRAPPHDRVVDLQGVLCAVPSARAGRKLLALLVEASESAARGLLPPRIVTLGALPETLYRSPLPIASTEERVLAWLHAVEATPEAATLSAQLDKPHARLLLARVGARLQATLAAERKTFADAAKTAMEMDAPRMQQRFLAWDAIYRRYLERLLEVQRADAFVARESAAVTSEVDIVLIGAADVQGQTLAMLHKVRSRVTSFVFAPPDLARRFDDFGRVDTDGWIDARVDLDDAQICFAETAREQALAAREAIAELGDTYALDDVSIGVLDDEVVAPIAEALAAEGVATHHASPRPFTETTVARLLSATAAVLGTREIEAACAWLRHHDVSLALNVRPRELEALDRYRFTHLPRVFAPPFLHLATPAEAAGLALVAERSAPELESLEQRVSHLLQPLESAHEGDLAFWARAAVQFLSRVYAGRELIREHPDDSMLLDALDLVLGFAERVQGTTTATYDCKTALSLILTFLEDEEIARPSTEPAIDLLGWLELLLDDAPCLFVLGLNDGFVPEAQNADAFLPNALKEKLGLAGNDRRHARDAYILASLRATRAKLFVTAGRRSLVGDPRLPSRLLFACEPDAQAARLQRFIHDRGPESSEQSGVFELQRPAPLPTPIDKLGVTHFKDYLACPYRFYLARVLRLDETTDRNEGEINPLTYGNLVHSLLQAFGTSPVKNSTDAAEIDAWLGDALDRAILIGYGTPTPPTVALQRSLLQKRLQSFARWQAKWRATGFVIAEVEHAFDDVPLIVDGTPFFLRGRIDRIDRHEKDGRLCVIDYKTNEKAPDPARSHFDGERWRDLQLPLYRYAIRQTQKPPGMALGFVSISSDAPVEWKTVPWDETVWQSAEACAMDVVRKIRAGEFPMSQYAPPGMQRFGVICQDGQMIDLEEEAE